MTRAGSPSDWQALGPAGDRCRELGEALAEAVLERDECIRRLHATGASEDQLLDASGLDSKHLALILLGRSRLWHHLYERRDAFRLAELLLESRGRIKQQVARGELDVAELIREPPVAVKSMQLADLLTCQRGWGKAQAGRLLLSLGLPPDVEVSRLSEDVRAMVVARLAVSSGEAW